MTALAYLLETRPQVHI